MADAGPILLYDGVCALCNWWVTFVLRRDVGGRFRFASLQSDVAREILMRHGRNPADLDTVVVVLDPGAPTERLLDRSSAAVFVVRQLSGPWRVLGGVLAIVPAPLRDVGYRLIARTRYRTFGKYDACPLPPPGARDRFLDVS